MTDIFIPRYVPQKSAPQDQFDRGAAQAAAAVVTALPQFAVTPLVALDKLAAQLGIAALSAKDERSRLGLGSFKALGGAFAVLSLAAEELSRRLDRAVAPAELAAGGAPKAAGMTFAAATAGNHGRAVAFGARIAGARSAIFVPAGVPPERVAAIAREGATVFEVKGTYDEALAEAAARSKAQGWTTVSDIASPGYEDIPRRIMRGYCVLAEEALSQMAAPATHLFVQGGGGGLAAPMSAYFAANARPAPHTVIVEPSVCPCLRLSVQQNQTATTAPAAATIMARLDCRTASSITWPVLRDTAVAFAAVDDDVARRAVRLLAENGIQTSPTGAAGLAGLLALRDDRAACEQIGFGAASRALVVITEEATASDAQ